MEGSIPMIDEVHRSASGRRLSNLSKLFGSAKLRRIPGKSKRGRSCDVGDRTSHAPCCVRLAEGQSTTLVATACPACFDLRRSFSVL